MKLAAGEARPPHAGVRFGMWVAIAGLFTLAMLQYSLRYGRLAFPIGYDDIMYLRDGLSRLNAFYFQNGGGFPGLVYQYWVSPPHSPYQSMIAMVGFGVFGPHDWAAYATNFVTLLVLLVTVDRLMAGTSMAARVGAAVFALIVPVAGATATEFRPDMMVGLLTAIVVMRLMVKPITSTGRCEWIGTGLILGFTLWAKPSVFPVTLTISGAALALAVARDRVVHKAQWRILGQALGWMLLPTVLVPLPHYMLDGQHIIWYIWVNIFGEQKRLWVRKADRWTHWTYYATGDGGMVMLGRLFWIMLGVFVAGLAAAVLSKRRAISANLAALFAVTAVAYLIPTMNDQKHQFLALVFDFLLVLAAIYVVRLVWVGELPGGTAIGGVLLMGMILGGAALTHWPVPWGTTEQGRAKKQVVQRLYDAMRREADAGSDTTVLFTVLGYVAADEFNYMIAKDGIFNWHFESPWKSSKIEDFVEALKGSDLVVAVDPGGAEGNNFPFTPNTGRMLEILRESDEFDLRETVPSVTPGINYYLFARIPVLGQWRTTSGLGRYEGPYAQWKLPVVRWGYAPETVVTSAPVARGAYRLVIDAESMAAGQVIHVSIDERAVGDFSFETNVFRRIDIPLNLDAGAHTVAIAYDKWMGGEGSQPRMALLYKGFRLEPMRPTTRPAVKSLDHSAN